MSTTNTAQTPVKTAKTSEVWAAYRADMRKYSAYQEALAVLSWDQQTGEPALGGTMPTKGEGYRAETQGVLAGEMFRIMVTDKMGEHLAYLNEPDVLATLTDYEAREVKEMKKSYDRSKKLPENFVEEVEIHGGKAYPAWIKAKENNDYATFAPYLAKTIAFNQREIDYYAENRATRLDTLLDMFEPDMTVERLDDVFTRLRKRLVPLVAAVKAAKDRPNTAFLQQNYPKAGQAELTKFLLSEIGYSWDRGRIAETEHPFMTGINHGDKRLTTHYYEDLVTSAMFSSLHEGGHALYEQNVSDELAGTPLDGGTSLGIHESQSRFWENIIGRSLPFWKHYYPKFQALFPTQTAGVSVEEFYRAINASEPSFIRIEADELTYNLHIIIRYEMEKKFINEGLTAEDAPAMWNALYTEYLGITPRTDSEGILQDVHWAYGNMGYFPTYALGNMYGAQIYHTLRQEMPQIDEYIAAGNLAPIREWLTDKVYQYGGARKPQELITAITGEELNPNYLADYLEKKYTEIYRLG